MSTRCKNDYSFFTRSLPIRKRSSAQSQGFYELQRTKHQMWCRKAQLTVLIDCAKDTNDLSSLGRVRGGRCVSMRNEPVVDSLSTKETPKPATRWVADWPGAGWRFDDERIKACLAWIQQRKDKRNRRSMWVLRLADSAGWCMRGWLLHACICARSIAGFVMC